MERCLCGIFIVTCVGAVPVTSPGLGSRRAGPGRMLWSPPTGAFSWRGGVRVPAAVSPSWLGDSWLIALGGLGPRGILCLLGGPCLCQPVPNLVPKGCPQAGGWAAEMGGGGVCRAPVGEVGGSFLGEQKPRGCPLVGSPVGWPLRSPRAGGDGAREPWSHQCLLELFPVSGAVSSAPFMCDG